jgi:hypothetical protein
MMMIVMMFTQKAEFDIASKTVSLLYFHALTLAALPWMPLSTIFVVVFFQLSFRFDKQFLIYNESKPKRPWKAQVRGTQPGTQLSPLPRYKVIDKDYENTTVSPSPSGHGRRRSGGENTAAATPQSGLPAKQRLTTLIVSATPP